MRVKHRRSARRDFAPVRLNPLDLLALGLVGIRTRKLRAALSALGVGLGIATLVLVVGIPAAGQRALEAELSAMGTDLLRAEPSPDQSPPVLLPEESVGMVRRIGPVTGASAVANTHAPVRRSDRLDETDGGGITVLAGRPDLLATVHGEVASGRFIGAVDADFPTVVLGRSAARRLGFETLEPGAPPPQVMVGKQWFTVVGILAPVPLAPELDRAVVVGWGSAKKHLGFDGHPTVVYVTAREDALEDVRDVLAPTLHAEAPGLVRVGRPSDALAAKRAAQHTFSGLFLGLAGVALLIGGVGIANTMVVSVLERRREIGLRRALGASKGQVRGQFLTESVVLSGLGGLAGGALGAVATLGYAAWRGWPGAVPWEAVAAGTGGALLVGVVAGVYPSVRAARLMPTEALAAS
ncbi:ABC transporter permease [Streptomyces sp. NPDC050504]|uniref:ABC transporter permease n=1 Tax=Streptomyces sp. NPDC050504 TaxID=3365618 RepID=UPI0037A4CD2C